MRRILTCGAVLICGILWAVAPIPMPADGAEERDPFVEPRVIPPQEAKLRLMGVVLDAAKPLAIVGEAVVTVGDIVGSWSVVEVRADGIVLERAGHRQMVGLGDLLPP